MEIKVNSDWKNFLKEEFESDYFNEISTFVDNELAQNKEIYPKVDNIFNAFNYCPLSDLKVVLLWQDPYHWPNQAHWLSFSVQDNTPLPPSLKNIYKEMIDDIWVDNFHTWDLSTWAKSWILMLNSSLTVERSKPNSHSKIWWQTFTDNVIKKLSQEKENLIFILWWNFAIQKKDIIDNSRHFILSSPHPSPFSARKWFFGCRHFSKTNEILSNLWKEKINWQINNWKASLF